ncbi:MAG TPA: hypothetical protein PKZ84_16520 [Anaerolineae bacterium]|nr:hypothetical protein [Anaerolineae bacterium]HQI86236.1 hypothetical protein [Anaerolineae bacterium]
MEYEHVPPTQIERWAAAIQERGLADVAIPLLDVLQIWGFVGGQVLWMLAPFVGKQTLAPFAEALEEPETLRRLQRCLREAEVQ